MRNDLRKLRTTFTPMYRGAMKCPAWQAMKPAARALNLEMKALYNRDSEGPVYMSARHAAKLLGVDTKTAVSLLKQNEHYGYTVKIAAGYLGTNGRGMAASWRLTDEPYQGRPATLDFIRWDGTPFSETKPRRKNSHRPVGVAPTYARGKNSHRAHRKARKNGLSQKTDPVGITPTHLDALHSQASEPVVSKAEPVPAFGIGHNEGPAWDDEEASCAPHEK